jgi:hypothetical protein
MIVALVALVLAASGTAVAAGSLVGGDKLIKKRSLSGNRLRNHTITGKQVNLKKLGKVPSAKNADHATSANSATTATSATSATSATNANNASNLGGQPASNFLTTASRIGTNGVVKVPGTASGNTVTLFSVGPFTVTLTCTKTGSGTTLSESGTSTEAGSDIDGNFVATAGTAHTLNQGQITAATTSPSTTNNENIDFEAPSGAQAVLVGATGVNSLGADCWANWAGIH